MLSLRRGEHFLYVACELLGNGIAKAFMQLHVRGNSKRKSTPAAAEQTVWAGAKLEVALESVVHFVSGRSAAW